MKKSFFVVLCSLLICLLTSSVFAETERKRQTTRDLPIEDIFSPQKAKVEAVADSIEYDRKAKKIIARGNVVLRHENTQVTGDYGEVETETEKVFAKGHVIVYHKGQAIAKGETIYYDFANNTASFPNGRALTVPWFITGEDIQQVREGVRVVENGTISTCNYEKPHYDIRAKKVTIYEGDKMVAWNVKIYALGKPIFWWPYLVIPIRNTLDLPFQVSAGYNSRFGAYIELTKGIAITDNISGKLHLDWRSKRGVGGGVDLDYDFDESKKFQHRGRIKTYLTEDDEAPTTNIENPFSQEEERTRGRVTWLHRTDVNKHTHMIFRYNRFSDEFFLQDFFENESRAEIEPQSFITFTANTERFGFFNRVEKRVNEFESLVERLPQAKFEWKNQPFIKPWLFYENSVSFDQLNKVFGRTKISRDVTRFDTFHEWSAPFKWKEVKFTPFYNARGTFYSRFRDGDDEKFRIVSGAGLDMRTQLYKTHDVSFDALGIEVNQLRHVMEPVFKVEHQFSNVSDEGLDEFDEIDRIDDANVIQLGIENRLQTKRVVRGRMQRVDLVSLNTFLSYELHPDGRSVTGQFAPVEGNSSRSGLTLLSQELVLRPYEWLQYQVRFDYDMERDQFRVFNQDLVVRSRKFRALFSHRTAKNIANFGGNDQFVFDMNYVINPLWAVGGHVRFRSGELEEWQIGATRDLHDFIFDFGYNVRNSSIENRAEELYFNFHLKAFPTFALRSGRRASFGAPRIGETVAGANQDIAPQTRFQS